MSNILITGATGHFGREAIEFLLQKGMNPSNISALVRNEAKASDLKEKGIKLIKGDYLNIPSLVSAFRGIDKLLFVSGNEIPDRATQHDNVVKAAKEAGVGHVLYTSFERKLETEASPIYFIAEGHLKAESSLKESGLNYTIFRNTVYLDYVPLFIGDKLSETNTIYLPAGDGKAGFALRKEMAEAAANVLLSSGHNQKSYYISNVEKYSFQEIAGIIGEITGREINYISPAADEFISTLKEAGVPEEAAAGSAAFAVALAQGEFDISGNDLEDLLGRKPTGMRDYLRTIYSNN